jgi:DNA repair exonuclease SbcCD ATPase subunit
MVAKLSTPKSKVSYKSPKPDIWRAYKELLENLKQEPAKLQIIQKIDKTTDSFKTNLSQSINNLHSGLTSEVSKIVEELKKAAQTLEELQQAHLIQEKTLKEEAEFVKKQKQREEEEYEYEFLKQKKRQQEELEEKKFEVFAELEERKKKLSEQEDELVDLKNQAKTFEARIEKAAKEAVGKTTEELTREFEHEKVLAEQEAKSTKSLLGQKIENLSKTITDLKKENERLNTALNQVSANMTRIAERAVEKAPAPITQSAGKTQTN